jgi:hypothetical protein
MGRRIRLEDMSVPLGTAHYILMPTACIHVTSLTARWALGDVRGYPDIVPDGTFDNLSA